jgi:hypothetical protein
VIEIMAIAVFVMGLCAAFADERAHMLAAPIIVCDLQHRGARLQWNFMQF